MVTLYVAIDEHGRGAVGVSESAVLNAFPGSRQMAVCEISVWSLCRAIVTAAVLPDRFAHRWGRCPVTRRRARWPGSSSSFSASPCWLLMFVTIDIAMSGRVAESLIITVAMVVLSL